MIRDAAVSALLTTELDQLAKRWSGEVANRPPKPNLARVAFKFYFQTPNEL